MVGIERWLPVVGYEGSYEVSDQGRVRSLERVIQQTDAQGNLYPRRMSGRMLKRKYCAKGPYGRWCTVLLGLGVEGQKYWLVHRLVLLAFIGPCPEDKEQGAHWDGNPENNALANLRWASQQENREDMTRHGRHRNNTGTFCRAFSIETVRDIREQYRKGATSISLQKKFSLSENSLTKILNVTGAHDDFLLRNFGLDAGPAPRGSVERQVYDLLATEDPVAAYLKQTPKPEGRDRRAERARRALGTLAAKGLTTWA